MLISLVGLCIIGLVMVDIMATTVAASAFSPVSRHIAWLAFKVLSFMPDSFLKYRLAGVTVMTAIASFWIFGIALGWTTVFYGYEGSVVETGAGGSAEFFEIGAFIGHLLSTLGGGLTKPGSVLWSLLSVLVGVNGMIVLTLSVSFVLSTTQTVALGQAFLAKLDIVDTSNPQSRQTVLFDLADLVAGLNAAPFALFYSSQTRSKRLPSGMGKLPGLWRELDDTRLRRIVSDLPWIELDENDDLKEALVRWSDKYDLDGPSKREQGENRQEK